jgi:prepilin peptidase CpaA
MIHFSPSQISVAALVLAAAATDFRSRRIPNWLTLSGVCAGFLLHGIAAGLAGIETSLMGMFLAFGIYLALYCLRAMGAGDVKLMAAVGAIVGPANWMVVFVASALAGGVLAGLMMIWKGRVRQTLWNTAFIVNELVHFRPPYRRRSDLDVKDARALNMPYGVAIAAGTMACLLLARI